MGVFTLAMEWLKAAVFGSTPPDLDTDARAARLRSPVGAICPW
jgi:hypothetical protein